MSKGLIAFIVVASLFLASLLIIQMKKSAVEARKSSDDIMEEFKRVDRSLQKSKESLDSTTNVQLDSVNRYR